MCLIVLAHRARPGVELLVAANRDELFERPARPADFWEDRPGILAGRDLRAGGTWLGVTRSGRFAAITNYRNPRERLPEAPSRGALVGDFLAGAEAPEAYLQRIQTGAAAYNGFSLLAGVPGSLWFYSNRDHGPYRVEPGIRGLSNHLLDEPWPKVVRSRRGLAALLEAPFDAEAVFGLLADETEAPDPVLPDTGLGIERERKASAIRIRDPIYGTRCSTILRMLDSGRIELHERSYAAHGAVLGTVRFEFNRQAS